MYWALFRIIYHDIVKKIIKHKKLTPNPNLFRLFDIHQHFAN